MSKPLKVCLVLLATVVLALSWPAWRLYREIQKADSDDPRVWEEDILALESNTRGQCAPGDCVVFIGSSSIRFWDTLAFDMSPVDVIRHGFGGAKLNDIVYYARRLVTALRPRAVVVFAGTNDIDPRASKSPQVLLQSYQAFVREVRAEQPGLPVYYIGITPSPLRWSVWPIAVETNRLIAEWSGTDANLHFIDTSGALLGVDGKPESDNYRFDGLHLSERGYTIWADIIRQTLVNDLGYADSPQRQVGRTDPNGKLKGDWH